MKKITLFLAAAIFSFVAQAQITLTHNTDNVITGANSVACGGGDNLTARHYVLADFGITGDFEITSGEIGVQSIDTEFIATVNVYEVEAPFPAGFPGTATLLGSQLVTMPLGSDLSIVNYTFDTPIIVPAGTAQILVEVIQDANGVQFWVGGTAGEDDDSWLASVTCSLPEYTTTTAIGFPDAHYYINVTGDEIFGVGDNIADLVSIYPNPTSNVLNVKVPSNVEILGSNLYDILGKDTGARLVNGTMTTTDLSQGVYILKVETSEGTITQKIVKN